jgi:pyrroloquinoline-quinone synthase
MRQVERLWKKLVDEIGNWSLLKHPFYESWEKGALPVDALRKYAAEYRDFISAFPGYWDAVKRDERTGSLAGELDGVVSDERTHADLWEQFSRGIGAGGDGNGDGVAALTETYQRLCADGLAATLGALFAFESQAAAVAHTKHDGLVAHFGITDADTLAYFREHFVEDETHLKVQRKALRLLAPEEHTACAQAARVAARALYTSLNAFLEKAPNP